MKFGRLLVVLTVIFLSLGEIAAQESTAQRTSRTRFKIVEASDGLTINFDGKLFARYDINTANKPFLWQIMGPTGESMTRDFPMEFSKLESTDQRDHPHQRGMLFGHESIGSDDWLQPKSDEDWDRILEANRAMVGGDTWHEEATYISSKRTGNGVRRCAMLARIKHREFKALDVNDDRAIVVQTCDYLDRDGRRFLEEQRTLTFEVSLETRTIDFEQILRASDKDVVFHDCKDAGLAIRVAASMAIDSKQGGQVINSAGQKDGDAWSKPAKWCDYHGPVKGEHLGIAILNHPSSFRFPTRWHVREYGLFAANPFGLKAFDSKLDDASTRLKLDESLNLKHRFIFHLGSAADAKIEEAWQQFAKEEKVDETK